ncbi:T9SS type A sorting domain-containing protein [candidate division KSB1 bacterium]|nr:T9SS type A sorting domain-containing protein [candidate division KSB1 bacterium]
MQRLVTILFLFSSVLYAQYSYLPSAVDDDGKMFIIAGGGQSSFVGSNVEIAIEVSSHSTQAEIGIFDGDVGGHWDSPYNAPLHLYTLYQDPNMDQSSLEKIAEWNSNELPDNSWFKYTHPTKESARNENGNFSYYLIIKSTDKSKLGYSNQFKVRALGKIDLASSLVAFSGALHSWEDVLTLYPNYPSFDVKKYDGHWTLYFYLEEPVEYLEIWDGDFDYFGPTGGPAQDTDDPDTPNDVMPDWAAGTGTGYEGKRGANPRDDGSSNFYTVNPPVSYMITDPLGNQYVNDNPSANQEWERFRIDTAPFDRSVMDYHADELPAGTYRIDVFGMDLHNYNAWKFFEKIIGQSVNGKPVPSVPVPYGALASVGDYVWYDADKDGQQDPNEIPLANAILYLYDESGQLVGKARSSADGKYLFDKIVQGKYTIQVDPSSLPDDYSLTTATPQFHVELEGGSHLTHADFGFVEGNGQGCKTVMAWFAPWYGSALSDSAGRHWHEDHLGMAVDSALFDFYFPEHGSWQSQYDSQSDALIEYQILSAWMNEIDAFVVEWYGKSSYENKTTLKVLDRVYELEQAYRHLGFEFDVLVCYHESALGDRDENLMYLADSVLTHPAYYQNHGFGAKEFGIPVFLYEEKTALDAGEFRTVLEQVTGQKVALFKNWDADDPEPDPAFDGIYPWVQSLEWDDLRGLNWGRSYLEQYYTMLPDKSQAINIAGVWPGYDDREWTLGSERWMDRQETGVYDSTWTLAMQQSVEWALIHSWNDYNRGTHVEISQNYTDAYQTLTRTYSRDFKGSNPCLANIDDEVRSYPQLLYNARRLELDAELVQASLSAFFEQDYARAYALLETEILEPESVEEKADHALVFVKGTPTYAKGDDDRSWQNAVDGDHDGWEGTCWSKGDESGSAWAIFRFADNKVRQFNYINFQTDNGSSDDAVEGAQAKTMEVLVSETGIDFENFESVIKLRRKSDGTSPEWRGLGRWVKAKYVMLRLHSPDYFRGGYRQIVEFEVQSDDKSGAKPASMTEHIGVMPLETELYPNYPNPFNPETTLSFTLAEGSEVHIRVLDVLGREVATPFRGFKAAGEHRLVWNARDLPSGVYWCHMQTKDYQATQKLLLVK